MGNSARFSSRRARPRLHVGSTSSTRRAVAWPATLAILAAFILAPTPAVADEASATADPVVESKPAEAAPVVESKPAEAAPAEVAPAEVAPAEVAPAEEPAAPASPVETSEVAESQAEATDEGPPEAGEGEEPASEPAALRSTQPTVEPQASAPTMSAFVAGDFGITLSSYSVLPGEDFTFTLTGCPYLADAGLLQVPYLQVVDPTLITNIENGDDVLGGIYSGYSGNFEGDPWVHTATVAPDAAPGGYRIYPKCQTRDAVGDPFTHQHGAFVTLTVLASPAPSETISPASGYAGDQFTANIENCPTGLGPGGRSITQNAADHSGPTPFLTAFQFVSVDASVEPKTYTWAVTDDAAPGDYTIIFKCYTEAGQPAEQMNPMTFTVLADPFVFDGVATIDSTSGYPGEELTITGTGCAGGLFNVGIGDPPGFLAAEDFELVSHNATSGDDPMWITIRLTESAAPGTYQWLPTCTIGPDEYDYEPLIYTLLEAGITPTGSTPTGSTPDDSREEESSHDAVVMADQALPATGSPASPSALFASMMAVLFGLLLVISSRRRA